MEPSDTVVSWAAAGGGGQCGFNRTHFRQIEIPVERKSAYSNITYDLTGNHEFYAELSYITVSTQSALEPFPMASWDVYGGDRSYGYPVDNPYVPAEMRDAAYAQNADNPIWTGHIPVIRRLEDVEARGSGNTRETFRVALVRAEASATSTTTGTTSTASLSVISDQRVNSMRWHSRKRWMLNTMPTAISSAQAPLHARLAVCQSTCSV